MGRRGPTPAEEAFVLGHKLGRLATASAAGAPHVVPAMYAFADGAFWLSSDPGDLKARNVAANPRAALVVDEPPPAKSGVTVRGRAELIRDGETFERAQDHLQAAGAAGRTRKTPGEQVYIRLEPESVASWRVDPAPPT
jgi:pyridoxamine 5'-phosphate oxidase family protein